MSSDFFKEIKLTTFAAQAKQREATIDKYVATVKANIAKAAAEGNGSTNTILKINKDAVDKVVNAISLEGFIVSSDKETINDPFSVHGGQTVVYKINVRWL